MTAIHLRQRASTAAVAPPTDDAAPDPDAHIGHAPAESHCPPDGVRHLDGDASSAETVARRDCRTCDECDALVPAIETVITLPGSTICAPYRRASYWLCNACCGWNPQAASCANECNLDADADADAQDEDEEEEEEGDGYDDEDDLVHDYDYKPRPVFHGAGPLYIGPEIEIEAPYYHMDDCAEIAQEHLGTLGYIKSDSSIGYGFEIVTHPMSYEWAIANFPWKMLTQLRKAGCLATDSTGIHVHVSRAGFASACHTYRWMKFIYRNERQVTTLARRYSEAFAAFTDQDRQAVRHYAKGGRGERYRAINTNNADTFELRIFAGSLDSDEVMAAFAFAAASVEYTRKLTVNSIATAGGWTWSAFVAWLAGRPAYEPLMRQLEALQCVC